MKLTDKMNLVETGGTAIMADHLMKIREEDQHVVIGIIRHKMYSNPIRTLIQEVCSNARDAHREQGCIDRPIRVKLPDKYDNSFYIQDFGVGISPDRMENVFVNYGASTKRSNDEQTGGFGLGAKSPFSYTDQFGIVCVTPDKSGNLILRQYMAIIDGKNSYVKQVEERPATADEERGTTIVVPVKPEDFAEFRKWAIDRCRYWAVRPEIISKEVKIEWPADTVEFKGSDNSWEIHVQPKVINYYDRNREAAVPKAIVDGIPYPLDRSSIEKASDAKENALIAPLWSYPVLLHFKTGEVGLTATREELDYSDTRTAKMIRKKFKDIITELQAKIEKEISQAKDFIEANIKWNSIKSSYNNIVGKVTWNGHDITGVGLSCHGLVKITQFYRDRTNVDGIGRGKVSSVSFSENLKFVYDITDSVGIARGKIVGMFESDPDLKNVYVLKAIAPDSLNSYNDIFKNKPNDFREKGTLKEVWDYFAKESKANLYNPVSIENLVRVKRKRATRVSSGVSAADVMAMRKFNNDSFSNHWLSCDKDHKKDKGLVVYLKNREAYLDSACEINVSGAMLKSIEKQLGVEIYGVISRYADKLGNGWTPLADRVKSEFDKLDKEIAALSVPLTKTTYSSSHAYSRINNILGKIDKNSDLFKFIENWKNEENNIKTYIAKTFKYNVFLEFLNVFYKNNTNVFSFAKKEIMLDSYADKLNERYPYLVRAESYHYSHITDNEKLEYIKAMDAYLGKF